MQQIAKNRNGKCLSTEYINSYTKLEWECEEGHKFDATPQLVSPKGLKEGSWCKKCSFNKRRTSMVEIQQIAKDRNGKCLSTEYINSKTKLEWECHQKHKWHAILSNVKSKGSWCPHCHTYLKEEMIRVAFEQIFNSRFINSRPKWLVNSRGNLMELDGYNQSLNIAFEHNGEQHYKLSRFNNNKDILEIRKKDDLRKIEICKSKKIYLFIFNYKEDLFDIINLFKKKSKLLKFDITNLDLNKKINFDSVYFSRNELLKLGNIAKDKGGKIISETYLGTDIKLKFQCNKGHMWQAEPGNIKTGNWCPTCAGKNPTIEEFQKIAKEKKGKCLSTIYINQYSKLKWECEEGHKFESSAQIIKSGAWCAACAGNKKLTLEEMQEIAKKKNGRCLSTEYINSGTKLEWECEEGHTWSAIPSNIIKGHWCPTCVGLKKLTLEEMQEIAKKKNGRCLSTEYINSKTKLEWECEEGHIWEAQPGNVVNGTWCLICGGKEKLSIKDMQQIAKDRNGKCLSTEYFGNKIKLEWECEKGHTWEAQPNNIGTGTWCPTCAGRNPTIEVFQKIAKERNGKCLSSKYINAKTKMEWECHLGHKWQATPDSVKRGSWCSYCSGKYKTKENQS